MKLTTLILILAFTCTTQAEPLVSDSLTSSPPMKNEILAYGLLTVGTFLPILVGANVKVTEGSSESNQLPGGIMIVSGILIGPSLGQFYAGSYSQGVIGLFVRGLGGLLSYAAFLKNSSGASQVLPVGIVIGGTLYSLVDTHFAVKRANEKAGAAHAAHFDLFPTLARSAVGSERMGMMARVEF